MRIGLISDTHGLLRQEAVAALAGVDRIIHAGDIGNAQILEALAAIAPVDAVRGNNDTGPWAKAVPHSLTLNVDGVAIHLLHDLKELKNALPPVQVVIAGHSHKPMVREEGGVLLVNPGSAGPRRFKLPVTVGFLSIDAGLATASITQLTV
ncbi:metallophosphoesterase family protein [Noviherbaspirillum soli]|uniref:metallophosphoesterase family protein n=1 Tax=Noviherbaspirillum soli TaxID=1064518 RepID=UPI00188D85ED|nr:metallophosphoesterase family protein [Noviherbaspirillum soli]